MNNKAFTLLEIMISIALLTIGTFTIIGVLSNALLVDADIETSTVALYLAQEKMEEIRDASAYSDIDSFASTKTPLTGDFAAYSREVTVSGAPKKVNVIVYWDVKGSELNVNLVNLFADYDY